MIIDMREIPYKEAFVQLRDAMNANESSEEVIVFVDSHEHEKSMAITGFAEILLGCKTAVSEAGGFYMIRIIWEGPSNIGRESQINTEIGA